MNPKKMDPGEILVRIRELRGRAPSIGAEREYIELLAQKRAVVADFNRRLANAHRKRRIETEASIAHANEIGSLRTELANRIGKLSDMASEAKGKAATKRDHAAKSMALATTYRAEGRAKADEAETERTQGDRGNRAAGLATDAAGLLAKADEADKRAAEASAEADRLDKIAAEHEYAATEARAAMAQVDSVMGG